MERRSVTDAVTRRDPSPLTAKGPLLLVREQNEPCFRSGLKPPRARCARWYLTAFQQPSFPVALQYKIMSLGNAVTEEVQRPGFP